MELPKTVEELQALLNKETEGLRKNRDEILGEKKKLAEFVEQLGGLESAKGLQELRTRIEKDELGKLLTSGQYDKWFDTRTEALRTSYQKQIDALNKKQTESEQQLSLAQKQLSDTLISQAVTQDAVAAGVVPEAVQDVLLRARGTLRVDENGKVVVLDAGNQVVLGKDGKSPLSPREWVDSFKDKAPHWWPSSQGAGAKGGRGASELTADEIGRMSMEQYRAFREKKK
jgi:hypothetical protein